MAARQRRPSVDAAMWHDSPPTAALTGAAALASAGRTGSGPTLAPANSSGSPMPTRARRPSISQMREAPDLTMRLGDKHRGAGGLRDMFDGGGDASGSAHGPGGEGEGDASQSGTFSMSGVGMEAGEEPFHGSPNASPDGSPNVSAVARRRGSVSSQTGASTSGASGTRNVRFRPPTGEHHEKPKRRMSGQAKDLIEIHDAGALYDAFHTSTTPATSGGKHDVIWGRSIRHQGHIQPKRYQKNMDEHNPLDLTGPKRQPGAAATGGPASSLSRANSSIAGRKLLRGGSLLFPQLGDVEVPPMPLHEQQAREAQAAMVDEMLENISVTVLEAHKKMQAFEAALTHDLHHAGLVVDTGVPTGGLMLRDSLPVVTSHRFEDDPVPKRKRKSRKDMTPPPSESTTPERRFASSTSTDPAGDGRASPKPTPKAAQAASGATTPKKASPNLPRKSPSAQRLAASREEAVDDTPTFSVLQVARNRVSSRSESRAAMSPGSHTPQSSAHGSPAMARANATLAAASASLGLGPTGSGAKAALLRDRAASRSPSAQDLAPPKVVPATPPAPVAVTPPRETSDNSSNSDDSDSDARRRRSAVATARNTRPSTAAANASRPASASPHADKLAHYYAHLHGSIGSKGKKAPVEVVTPPSDAPSPEAGRTSPPPRGSPVPARKQPSIKSSPSKSSNKSPVKSTSVKEPTAVAESPSPGKRSIKNVASTREESDSHPRDARSVSFAPDVETSAYPPPRSPPARVINVMRAGSRDDLLMERDKGVRSPPVVIGESSGGGVKTGQSVLRYTHPAKMARDASKRPRSGKREAEDPSQRVSVSLVSQKSESRLSMGDSLAREAIANSLPVEKRIGLVDPANLATVYPTLDAICVDMQPTMGTVAIEALLRDYEVLFTDWLVAADSEMGEVDIADGLLYKITSGVHSEVVAVVEKAFAAIRHPEQGGPGMRWQRMPQDAVGFWNVQWTWARPDESQWARLLVWQRINHFPNSSELTRKDLLKRNIQRYHYLPRKVSGQFEVIPQTFILPREYRDFLEAFTVAGKENKQRNYWIVKPAHLSRGRGITIVNDALEVPTAEKLIVQQYITKPLLLDGRKFDIRLYVLVTSFAPLRAYIYREGFGRFAMRPYDDRPVSISDRFIHLTNSSVQRGATEAYTASSDPHQWGGTKCSLSFLADQLEQNGISFAGIWASIVDVVLKSLLCVETAITSHPNSFEVFGYDLLIDGQLKVHLLEVNASPSLACDSPLDHAVKESMVADTVRLVAPLPFDRRAARDVIRARLSDPFRHVSVQNLNADLQAILQGRSPRAPLDPPAELGGYLCVAPSPEYTALRALVYGKNA